uniref:ribosomal protein L32 n=1 Tax=Gleadovia mupinensis TaxID=2028288 RepID=UPI003001E805|nr:ribosomal protein L32 [Gleadovia mupinensis]
MAVPKKRTSAAKRRIRKNFWKKEGYWIALKAFSLGKSLSTGNLKTFFFHIRNKYITDRADFKINSSSV